MNYACLISVMRLLLSRAKSFPEQKSIGNESTGRFFSESSLVNFAESHRSDAGDA